MLGVYLTELLAIVGVWVGRRRLSVWLMALVAVVGIVALGLVVANIAALFRLRYVFCMLLLIMAAAGARHALALWDLKRSGERDSVLT